MLTCIACSKQVGGGGGGKSSVQVVVEEEEATRGSGSGSKQQSIKALTAQIKDIALKASGAYRHCKPCAGGGGSSSQRHRHHHDSDTTSFQCSYHRHRHRHPNPTPRLWGKEMEARLKGLSISSGETTPSSSATSASMMRSPPPPKLHQDDDDDHQTKEWVAQVEPGVLITFLSLPRAAGNDLKRIRFSREMFNKWQAQRWWADNYDKVMELYNVQRFNQQAVPLPNPLRSEDESSKIESVEDSPMTPPLSKERLPHNFHRPVGMGYSSSDSLEHHPMQSRNCHDSMGLNSTPKISSISGAKTETSSMDASIRTSSSREADRSGELSISNASDMETEWVEQDEPGVYITIRALPGNIRELRRVRFSRERFGEMHARLWWEENRARIHEQYL